MKSYREAENTNINVPSGNFGVGKFQSVIFTFYCVFVKKKNPLRTFLKCIVQYVLSMTILIFNCTIPENYTNKSTCTRLLFLEYNEATPPPSPITNFPQFNTQHQVRALP